MVKKITLSAQEIRVPVNLNHKCFDVDEVVSANSKRRDERNIILKIMATPVKTLMYL